MDVYLSDVSLSASAPNAAKKRRRIITREGSAILLDAYNSGLTNPTIEQRKTLLEQIKRLPGCENYKAKNVHAWFSNPTRRSKSSISKPKRYSTIKTTHIDNLRTLYAGTKEEPSAEVVSTWAHLIDASAADVQAWIDDEKEKELGVESSEHQDLPPTPLSIPSSRFPSPVQDEQSMDIKTASTLTPTPAEASSFSTPTLPTVTPDHDFEYPARGSQADELVVVELLEMNSASGESLDERMVTLPSMSTSASENFIPTSPEIHKENNRFNTSSSDGGDIIGHGEMNASGSASTTNFEPTDQVVTKSKPEPELSSLSWVPSIRHLLG